MDKLKKMLYNKTVFVIYYYIGGINLIGSHLQLRRLHLLLLQLHAALLKQSHSERVHRQPLLLTVMRYPQAFSFIMR